MEIAGLTILICALLSTSGMLTDYLLRKKEKIWIENKLQDLFFRLQKSTLPDLRNLMVYYFLRLINYVIGKRPYSIKNFFMIFLLSYFLTDFAMRSSNCLVLPSMQNIIMLVVYGAPFFVLSYLGYSKIEKYLKFIALVMGIQIILSLIFPTGYQTIFGFFDPSHGQLSIVESLFFGYRNIVINLIFDLTTIWVTLAIVPKIFNSGFVKTLILIIVDLLIAFALAVSSGSVFLIVWLKKPLYFFQVMALFIETYSTVYIPQAFYSLEPDKFRILEAIFFSSTTFIPTLIFMVIILSLLLLRVIIEGNRLAIVYVLQSRLENEEILVFTVLVLMGMQ